MNGNANLSTISEDMSDSRSQSWGNGRAHVSCMNFASIFGTSMSTRTCTLSDEPDVAPSAVVLAGTLSGAFKVDAPVYGKVTEVIKHPIDACKMHQSTMRNDKFKRQIAYIKPQKEGEVIDWDNAFDPEHAIIAELKTDEDWVNAGYLPVTVATDRHGNSHIMQTSMHAPMNAPNPKDEACMHANLEVECDSLITETLMEDMPTEDLGCLEALKQVISFFTKKVLQKVNQGLTPVKKGTYGMAKKKVYHVGFESPTSDSFQAASDRALSHGPILSESVINSKSDEFKNSDLSGSYEVTETAKSEPLSAFRPSG